MAVGTFHQSARNKPIGAYLIEAGLLSTAQVEVILTDQQCTELKFGEIAALRGWIKQQTVEYLMSKIISPERHNQTQPSLHQSQQQTILLPGQRLPEREILNAIHQPLPRNQSQETFVQTSPEPSTQKTSAKEVNNEVNWMG
jgi:hypothetical protein